MKRILTLLAALLMGAAASAQRFSVATNVLDYADFGTLNIEGDVAVARQWTLVAGAKYNPFLYKADTPNRCRPGSNSMPQAYAIGPGMCFRAGGSGERSSIRNTTGEGSVRPRRTKGTDTGRASPPVFPTCFIRI